MNARAILWRSRSCGLCRMSTCRCLGGYFAVALLTLGSGATGHAENWPSFRGPQGTGISAEPGNPLKWSDKENKCWRVPLPDRGNSTPAIWGDRVFVTQAIEQEGRRTLLCFDRRDGNMRWQRGITFEDKEPTNTQNPYCSSSPATDGKHVVVSFGSPGLYCYDLEGEEIWHQDLGDVDSWHGSGSSPIIHDGICYLNFGPGTGSLLVACDVETGDVLWRAEQPKNGGGLGFLSRFFLPLGGGRSRSRPPANASGGSSDFDNAARTADFSGKGGFEGSWSTPVILRVDDRDELVLVESSRVAAYEPRTGKELWHCGGLPPQVFATPAIGDGILVAMGHTTPSGTRLIAVRFGGDGDVSKTNRLWEIRLPKDIIGSGIVANGCVFLVAENGVAICLDSSTGEKKWERRLRGSRSRGGSWSSLVLSQGKLLVGNHSGEVFVLEASPEFHLIETNSIPEETTCASPAVAHNQVFLRTYEALWCFGSPVLTD